MISQKAQYGLRAVVALAAEYGKTTLQAKEIAERQDVPIRYLELLLSKLRRARLVDANRGKTGGYFLTNKPSNISVYDVLTAFENTTIFSHQVRGKRDGLANFWLKAEEMMKKHLKSVKISDLV